MISKIYKNCMGTVSVVAKFGKMRNAADFVVYPMNSQSNGNLARIQSNNYSGFIDLRDDERQGQIYLAKGSNSFSQAKASGKLSAENFQQFIDAVRASASPMAGSNGVMYCDNSAASGI